MSDRPRRNLPVGIVAAVGSAAVAVGAGVAWWNATLTPAPMPAPSATASQSPPIAATPSPTISAAPQSPAASPAPVTPIADQSQIYWLKDTGTSLAIAGQPAKPVSSSKPDDVVRGAIEQVLTSKPTDTNLSSAIPPNTRLLDSLITPEGIRVNLSAEFTSGGGSASMMGRLGQIVYTASTLNPQAKIWILVEGQPLTVLGGEGIEVPQPIDRALFDRQFKP